MAEKEEKPFVPVEAATGEERLEKFALIEQLLMEGKIEQAEKLFQKAHYQARVDPENVSAFLWSLNQMFLIDGALGYPVGDPRRPAEYRGYSRADLLAEQEALFQDLLLMVPTLNAKERDRISKRLKELGWYFLWDPEYVSEVTGEPEYETPYRAEPLRYEDPWHRVGRTMEWPAGTAREGQPLLVEEYEEEGYEGLGALHQVPQVASPALASKLHVLRDAWSDPFGQLIRMVG